MASRATRDDGLRRIGRGTRYLAVGALLAGGVLSAAVAKAIPGKNSPKTVSTGTSSVTTPAGRHQTGTDQTVTTLAPPVQVPQQVNDANNPPVVSSGGS